MSRNYERDERESWRRQGDDYDWRRPRQQDRNWRQEEEMNEGFRGQHMQGGVRFERGGADWQNDRGWDRDRGYQGRSWEGDWGREPRESRMGWIQGQGQHAGRGPRGFKRQDNRIEEDINEQLTRHSMIDATDIEVHVQNGEVTLRGHVDSRQSKRMAEDIAESVFGVKDIINQIKIKNQESEEKQRDRKAS